MQKTNPNINAIVAALAIAVCFFMPWVKAGFFTASGYDIVFSSTYNQGSLSGIMILARWLPLALPLAAAGILLGAFTTKYFLSRQLLCMIPLLAIIGWVAILLYQASQAGLPIMDNLQAMMKTMAVGYWVTVVASVYLAFISNKNTATAPQQPFFNQQQTQIPPHQTYQQPQQAQASTSATSQPELDALVQRAMANAAAQQQSPVQPQPQPVMVPAKNNNSGLVVLGVIVVGAIGIYYFFMRNDPTSDAKKISAEYCNCTEENNKLKAQAIDELTKNFEQKNYKSKAEAKQAYETMLRNYQTQYDNCITANKSKFSEKKLSYSSKPEDATLFENTYNTLINTCSSTQSSVLATSISALEAKINLLKDEGTGAGEEQIKRDLVGRQIPGYTFNSASDFISFQIVNKTGGSDRMEYTINFTVNDAYTGPHTAQIKAIYLPSGSQWYLSEVQEVYITYAVNAPVGQWQRVDILQGCRYTISVDRMFWAKDGDYGQTYKGGGADGENFQMNSAYIFVASREQQPVTLTFTYYPQATNAYNGY